MIKSHFIRVDWWSQIRIRFLFSSHLAKWKVSKVERCKKAPLHQVQSRGQRGVTIKVQKVIYFLVFNFLKLFKRKKCLPLVKFRHRGQIIIFKQIKQATIWITCFQLLSLSRLHWTFKMEFETKLSSKQSGPGIKISLSLSLSLSLCLV